MNLKVNSNSFNLLQQEEKGVKKKTKSIPEKPQIKEHCSKKASNAIRNLALGVMVAAGVVSTAAKQMPVYAAEANQPVNPTSVSEQAEVNTAKTDVEMMVEQAITENQQDYSYVRVGKGKCTGDMTKNIRNYETAEIAKDGTLRFYDETYHIRSQVIIIGGQTNVIPQTEYDYKEMNSFTLGENVEKSTIKLQPGTRFNETIKKNGDYIELAEDGKTFNVYDSSGNQIGECSFKKEKSKKQDTKDISNSISQSTTNSTSVSEQAEVNTQKKDIEKVANQSVSENKHDLSSIHISNSKIDCQGEMTGANRCYEKAEITKDGTLHFYNETYHIESQIVIIDGHTNIIPKTEYDYQEMNSFTLGENVEKSTIKLQPGTRFNETIEKNGDYIELAEDGKTFNVYDSSGNQIGNCTFKTEEEHAETSKIAAAIVSGAVGGAAVTGGGIVGAIAIKKKIDEL